MLSGLFLITLAWPSIIFIVFLYYLFEDLPINTQDSIVTAVSYSFDHSLKKKCTPYKVSYSHRVRFDLEDPDPPDLVVRRIKLRLVLASESFAQLCHDSIACEQEVSTDGNCDATPEASGKLAVSLSNGDVIFHSVGNHDEHDR